MFYMHVFAQTFYFLNAVSLFCTVLVCKAVVIQCARMQVQAATLKMRDADGRIHRVCQTQTWCKYVHRVHLRCNESSSCLQQLQ